MDYAHKLTDDELKALEKRISDEYKQAEKEVEEKLNNYLADFARKDAIEAQKVADGIITQKEYDNWRVNQMATGKRWDNLRNSLAEDYHNANMIARDMTTDQSKEVYALNYNYGGFEVESATGLDTGFILYDKSTVERLMRDDPQMLPPPGKKVAERIKAGQDVLWNNQQIQSVMMQSLLQGESIGKIATRLATAVGDSNRAAAIRNARTMTTGAENAGRVDSYKRAEEMGIKLKQMWIATLDERTRQSHRELDGQSVEPGEVFVVDGHKIRYPGDPTAEPSEVYNCRCTLVAKFPGVPYTFAERGTDKEEYLEWKKGHEEAAKSEPIEETKVEPVELHTEHPESYELVKGAIDDARLKSVEVKELENELTSEQIIEKLAGGDYTKGSCMSLAYSYAANRCGLDVTDFRGGKSQDFFARSGTTNKSWRNTVTIFDMANIANADCTHYDIASTSKLMEMLNGLPVDKEYILIAGRHASVICNTADVGLQYLELQSPIENGWKPFLLGSQTIERKYTMFGEEITEKHTVDVNTLHNRFSYKGQSMKYGATLVDVDSFQATEELKEIFGYINTESDLQKKGQYGSIK